MGNGALRPKAEDSLRAIAELPKDGSDLAGSTVEELISHIVEIRGIVRANLLQYDQQVEIVMHSKVKKEEKKDRHSVLLPEALSKFCTIKNSSEMESLYGDVYTAQMDFEETKGADDTALREAVSALMTQLPEYIDTRARAPGSLPQFTTVVNTGNQFFEGVYTQVQARGCPCNDFGNCAPYKSQN